MQKIITWFTQLNEIQLLPDLIRLINKTKFSVINQGEILNHRKLTCTCILQAHSNIFNVHKCANK